MALWQMVLYVWHYCQIFFFDEMQILRCTCAYSYDYHKSKSLRDDFIIEVVAWLESVALSSFWFANIFTAFIICYGMIRMKLQNQLQMQFSMRKQ